MYKLLKLSNIAINISHISKIHISPDKYSIHLINLNIDGTIFLGSGGLDTTPTIIEVNKNNHPDYFKVSDYILKYSI
jgi:hypothetical protein